MEQDLSEIIQLFDVLEKNDGYCPTTTTLYFCENKCPLYLYKHSSRFGCNQIHCKQKVILAKKLIIAQEPYCKEKWQRIINEEMIRIEKYE